MEEFHSELHVHTVLSPCADVEMIPPLIVQEAIDRGIHLIAITDHNASANIQAVQRAAVGTKLTVLPGMEVETQEEVHVLCLFDTLSQMEAWQARVNHALPMLDNNVDYFGDQFIVDETGDFIRREPRLLLTAAHIPFDAVVTEVKSLGGLAIPAHIDRKANGLLANLGMVPQTVLVEALEISRHLAVEKSADLLNQMRGYPLLRGGDAHRLDELLGANLFYLDHPNITELRLALNGQEGRYFSLRA
jgi:PHP family Zn ribbon phosphoesterase